MILAAGKGKRLRPLTEEIPKSMLEINDLPILYYHLTLFKKYNIKDVIVNLNHKPEKIKAYLGKEKFGVNIEYSYEKKLLGTAGAVKKAEDFFSEDFFIIYGDIITDMNLEEAYEFHKQKGGITTLCLHKITKNIPSSSIITLDDNQQVRKFIEKPEKKDLELIKGKYKLVNSGIYIFKKSIFDYIPKNIFSDFALNIFPKLLDERQKIFGYTHEKCYWAEIGRLEKYNKIKKELENGNVKLNI